MDHFQGMFLHTTQKKKVNTITSLPLLLRVFSHTDCGLWQILHFSHLPVWMSKRLSSITPLTSPLHPSFLHPDERLQHSSLKSTLCLCGPSGRNDVMLSPWALRACVCVCRPALTDGWWSFSTWEDHGCLLFSRIGSIFQLRWCWVKFSFTVLMDFLVGWWCSDVPMQGFICDLSSLTFRWYILMFLAARCYDYDMINEKHMY